MTETDCFPVSKPIPPFGSPQNGTAVNAPKAEKPGAAEPNFQPLKAKVLTIEATETKAIEADTLETLRSLCQPSSAITIAIDADSQASDSQTSDSQASDSQASEPEKTPNGLISSDDVATPDDLATPDKRSAEIIETASFLTTGVETTELETNRGETTGLETSTITATSAAPLDIEAPQAFESTAESSPAPPLYFLVVNYHNAALISDLLHTLEANQGIVLINNSPIDRVVHRLAGQTYANGTVTVLDAPSNVGFSTACNLGLDWIYARSPNALVWLIKSDAQLVPRAVASVRQCFTQRPDLALLGTPILNASGKPWFAAGQFNPWLGLITSQRLGKADVLGRPIPTRWVSSGSMIFNFAVLGHCPQFDDTYFLYYEDCDLCERYFQQGAAIALTPSPLIVRSGTTALSRYTYPRHTNAAFSRLTFLRRHGTPLALALNLLALSAKALLLKVRNRTAAQGCWQGIQRFLTLPRH